MDNKTFQYLNDAHLSFIQLSKTINEVLEEEQIQISREQLGVFKLLNEQSSLSINEIAHQQGVFKTAISKRIAKLEKHGYVIKKVGEDKREKRVQLTEKGQTFYQERQLKLYQGLIKKLNLNDEDISKILNHIHQIQHIVNQ